MSESLSFTLGADALETIANRAAELVVEYLRLDSPWMDRRQAAAYLQLPASRLEKDRTIPSHKDGGRVLYHRDELDAHFKSR